MKQAIIDMGSNSMRLSVYEVEGRAFRILFREKIMAGLAGYVSDGLLSEEGIDCAGRGLLEFRRKIELLGLENVHVFATASLRNIRNTDEAVTKVHLATGYPVEVISGEEEARFGYYGAMQDLHLQKGAFVDIGGASTEITVFNEDGPVSAVSYNIGSLSLYRDCVKRILPGEGSVKRMRHAISAELDQKKLMCFHRERRLACVGGTSRAVLKLAQRVCGLEAQASGVTLSQLETLYKALMKSERAAAELILKLEPDRIHTMIPGLMILMNIVRRFEADEIVVSKYGVREGYLCQNILKAD